MNKVFNHQQNNYKRRKTRMNYCQNLLHTANLKTSVRQTNGQMLMRSAFFNSSSTASLKKSRCHHITIMVLLRVHEWTQSCVLVRLSGHEFDRNFIEQTCSFPVKLIRFTVFLGFEANLSELQIYDGQWHWKLSTCQ